MVITPKKWQTARITDPGMHQYAVMPGIHNLGVMAQEETIEDPTMAAAIINVDACGAVPYDTDPTADIGEVINDLISDLLANTKHGIIFIPGRAYGQKTEIVVPGNLNAFNMMGVGINYMPGVSAPHMGTSSQLIWTGADGGTMMTVSSAFAQINNITFCGAVRASGTHAAVLDDIDHAANGLIIDYEEGPGTGKLYCPRIAFALCDVGLQFGVGTNPSVCDQSRIEFIYLDNNGIGVKASGPQQVGISIGKFAARRNTTIFWSKGRMSVDSGDVLASNGTLMYVDGHSAITRISNIQMDSNTEDTLILDASSLDGSSVINIDNLHLPSGTYYTLTSPVIKLRYNVLLNISHSHWLVDDMIQCTGANAATDLRSTVIVSDSMMRNTMDPANLVDESESTAPWTLEYRGMRSYYGEAYADAVTKTDP